MGPDSRVRFPYVPALDGLRGLAVAAVLLFHGGVPGARGGHLGVTAFFTLSGFLITALLLLERRTTGRIDLRAFWTRRARRLVPAVLVCLPLVAVVVGLSPTPASDDVTWDAVAAALWVANWRFVADEQTYGDLFALPSPFQHFWSLAVEEQFYLLYPLLVVALLGSAAVLRTRRLAVVLGALTVLSSLQLFRLAEAGEALGRAYYGTDARIAELLVGALLALALTTPQGLRVPGRWAGPAGLVGLAGLVVAMVLLEKGDGLLYAGGYLAVAGCTAAVVAAALRPETLVAKALSVPALVALGVMSYGVYLFHWPLFLLLTESFRDIDPVSLFLAQVGATLAMAWLSYALVEWPVRNAQPLGLAGGGSWAAGAVAGVATIAVASGQIVLPFPTPAAVPVPVVAVAPQPGQLGAPEAPQPLSLQPQARVQAPGPAPAQAHQQPQAPTAPVPPPPRRRSQEIPKEFLQDPGRSKVPPPPEVPPGALRVAVVGDSIGVNLGQGLAAWSDSRADVAVYNLAVPACPISRGGERRISDTRPYPMHEYCGWWDDVDDERRRALQDFEPDVVVLQDGVSEVFDRRLPEWGEWRRPGQPSFDSWLVEEYRTAAGRWGGTLLLTNAPCGDWDRYAHFRELDDAELRVSALNLGVYNRVPGTRTADLHQRLCPGGQYRDDVEGVENGRPDGFHLSREASYALARNWLGPLVLDAGKAGSTGPLTEPPGPRGR